MAPVTRNGTGKAAPSPKPRNFLSAQSSHLRESGWDFGGSEPRSEGSRAASEEPGSYDGEDDDYHNRYEDGTLTLHAPMPQGTDTHDDILHPLREAANRVGREVEKFAEVLDEYNPLKAADEWEQYEMAFDMVDRFHSIAVETAERLREHHAGDRKRHDGASWRKKMRGFISQDIDDEMDDVDEDESGALVLQPDMTGVLDLKRWEDEAQTWDLLKRMLKLQFPPPNEASRIIEPINKYSSERQLFDNFLNTDSKGRERETVLQWLRDTANNSGEDIDVLVQELQQSAERGDIVAHGWLHTKAALKNSKRINTWPGVIDHTSAEVKRVHINAAKTEPLITQLDPDAPSRQNLKLEAQDEYFERAIWLGCYELLRRGKTLDEIKEWCQDRTEIWRAVSMSGLPDMEVEDSENAPTYKSTLLWRRMCYALARRGGTDAYEKAVYGILSGDLESVAPVCSTWNDRLFAHYNSLLRTQFEAYIVANEPSRAPTAVTKSFTTFDALQYHGGDQEKLGAHIVQSLKSDRHLKEQANEPLKLIQAALISNDFMDFVVQQGVSCAKQVNAIGPSSLMPAIDADPTDEQNTKYISVEDHDSMRVIAHIFIIFKSLGANLGTDETEHAVENVVVSYINFLRLAGKEELVSLYAAQLSEERCYDVLSRSMIDVVEVDHRITQIKLMTDLGLDVQRFVKLQTQNLLADYPEPKGGYPADESLRILLPRLGGRSESPSGFDARGEQELEPCRIDPTFLGAAIERPDMLLVRSLEWHLLVDGLWTATYRTGTQLYKRFFRNMKLSAAKVLSQNVPSEVICQSKTQAIVGEELSLADLELEEEYEEIPDDADEEEILQRKLLQRHMLAETKSYRELERLMLALEFIWDAGNHLDMYTKTPNSKMKKDIRVGLHGVLNSLRPHMGAILDKNWLKTSRTEEPEFEKVRQAYLPEIILAFDHILRLSGGILSRDNLLECINLSTIVAAEDSDLAELFVKKGRIAELVETFASDSLALLVATGPGKTKGGVSKKLRSLGWKRDVWALVSKVEEPEEEEDDGADDM